MEPAAIVLTVSREWTIGSARKHTLLFANIPDYPEDYRRGAHVAVNMHTEVFSIGNEPGQKLVFAPTHESFPDKITAGCGKVSRTADEGTYIASSLVPWRDQSAFRGKEGQ